MKNSLLWLWLVSNRYKDNVNGWSWSGIRGGVVTSGGTLWPSVGTFVDVFLGGGTRKGDWREWSLPFVVVDSQEQAGLGREAGRLLPTSRDFCSPCLYKQVLYFHVSYFGFLLCRVGMSFLQRPENGREGREVWHWNQSEWSSWWMNLLPAAATAAAKSCLTLCEPIDGSPIGSPVPGILQARTLEWVPISFSNAWKWKGKVKLLSCLTLSDPMDHSLPGSSVHGIFQARVLEWGAIAFFGIFYLILSKYICSLYLSTYPALPGRVPICTNRYMFINCPIAVEGLLSQQGPFLGKTAQWLKFISAPPSPSPPFPTDSIAQSIIVVKDLVNFCLKRWPFSWSWFILIIELILHFPVHYLIWQQPCEEGSHGHYFPKGISDSLRKNSHLLSTSRLPDPVPNALHTLINHHVHSQRLTILSLFYRGESQV